MRLGKPEILPTFSWIFAQSAGAVEYTDSTSAEWYPPPHTHTSVLDVTQNNLMVRFQ